MAHSFGRECFPFAEITQIPEIVGQLELNYFAHPHLEQKYRFILLHTQPLFDFNAIKLALTEVIGLININLMQNCENRSRLFYLTLSF